MKGTPISRWLLGSGLGVVLLGVGGVLSASAADPFHEVAEKANRKLVKIFGAGGFSRLNNFGTGIIVSPEGHILTVASQLLDTPDLVVHLYDGQRLRAQVLVIEPELDAALLKIRVEGKRPDEPAGLELDYFDIEAAAQRPRAEVGDWVLALSNTFEIALRDEPLSLQRGVVMAYTKMAGRRGIFEFPYTGEVYIVDAITNNPGAAGGALLDRKGNLLGIIGRELRNTLSDTWMNYAIPVQAAVEIKVREPVKDKEGRVSEQERTVHISLVEFVKKGVRGEYKPVSRPQTVVGEGGWHGIIFVPNVLERTPAYVEDVVPGSPAAKAGLRPDDLISFVDGEPIVSIKAFQDWIRKNTRPGMTIRLEVRRGEALQTVELTLASPPPRPQPPRPTPAPPKAADAKTETPAPKK
ncbi:MAG: S1C family serine protease [Gemmataceae bacterium]|nr:S1C family serine protease [Gemmataceae bacterium]MDW8242522.1 S1C family serine protease [Thermogemmata sp.]